MKSIEILEILKRGLKVVKGINTVMICGKLSRAPWSNDAKSVCLFQVDVEDYFKSKKTNDFVKKTSWINCKAFGETGMFIAERYNAGDMVLVEGSIESNYKKAEGEKKGVVELFVLVKKIHTVTESAYEEAAKQDAPQGALSIPNAATDSLNEEEIPF